jgi:hypothetical protein
MATTLHTVGPTLLTATNDTVLYTVPGATTFIIRAIRVANSADVGDAWFTLSIGTDAIGTRLNYQQMVLSKEVYSEGLFLPVATGLVLRGRASVVNAMSIVLAGTLET